MARPWSDLLASSLDPSTIERKINSLCPLDNLLKDLWVIIERLDPQEAAFERFVCMSQYILAMRMTYVRIVDKSSIFRNFRADTSEFISKYQRGTDAEFECFVFYSMLVINSWKTGAILEESGLRILRSMKHRFPEMRRWETILDILQNVVMVPPLFIAEWKDDWLQSSLQG